MTTLATLPVWPVAPDWRDGVLERLEWNTDVLTSNIGTEQRRQMRLSPKRSFEINFADGGRNSATLDNILSELGVGPYLLPVWHDSAKLTQQSLAGSQTIFLDTTNREFVVGGLALIRGTTLFDSTVVTIAGIAADRIVTTTGIPSTRIAGSKVYPLVSARIEDPQISQIRKASAVSTRKLKFVCTESTDSVTGGFTQTFNGYPFWDLSMNWIEDRSMDYQRTLDIFDPNTGRKSFNDTTKMALTVQEGKYMMSGRADHATFRRYLYDIQGRINSFYMASGLSDFKVASDVAAKSTQMICEQNGYSLYGGVSDNRSAVQITTTTQGTLRKNITSTAYDNSGLQTVVCDPPFTTALPAASVKAVSLMRLVRLDQDVVEIQHHTTSDGVSECLLRFRGLKTPIRQETLNWLARCPTRPTDAHINRVNRVIDVIIRSGWWAKADVIRLYNADTVDVACLNLVGPLHAVTPLGGPGQPVATFTPGVGFSFNAPSQQYLSSDVDLSKLTNYALTDCSIFTYCLTDIPGPGYIVAASSTAGRAGLRTRNGINASVYCNTIVADNVRVASGQGFLGVARLASDATGGQSYTAYKSGTYQVFARPPTGLPTGPYNEGRFANGASYVTATECVSFIGGGMSTDQMNSIYDAIRICLIDSGAIADDSPPDAEVLGTPYFTQAMLAFRHPPNLQISMQAAPPPNDSTPWNFFPATIFSTGDMNSAFASTETTAQIEHFLWGDRPYVANFTSKGFPNSRPNLTNPLFYSGAPPRESRFEYSSLRISQIAWLCKQRFSAGALPRNDNRYPNNYGYLDLMESAGLPTSAWLVPNIVVNGDGTTTTTFVSSAGTFTPEQIFTKQSSGGFNYNVATDMIYQPLKRLCDLGLMPNGAQRGIGFVADNEEQTNVDPNSWIAYMLECGASCHATGHTFRIYTNPIDGAGAAASGVSMAGLQQLMGSPLIDALPLTVYPQNTQGNVPDALAAQLAMYGSSFNPAKAYLVIGFGAKGLQLTDSDSDYICAWMAQYGITSLMYWRDYGVQGGDVSRRENQIIGRTGGFWNGSAISL